MCFNLFCSSVMTWNQTNTFMYLVLYPLQSFCLPGRVWGTWYSYGTTFITNFITSEGLNYKRSLRYWRNEWTHMFVYDVLQTLQSFYILRLFFTCPTIPCASHKQPMLWTFWERKWLGWRTCTIRQEMSSSHRLSVQEQVPSVTQPWNMWDFFRFKLFMDRFISLLSRMESSSSIFTWRT